MKNFSKARIIGIILVVVFSVVGLASCDFLQGGTIVVKNNLSNSLQNTAAVVISKGGNYPPSQTDLVASGSVPGGSSKTFDIDKDGTYVVVYTVAGRVGYEFVVLALRDEKMVVIE